MHVLQAAALAIAEAKLAGASPRAASEASGALIDQLTSMGAELALAQDVSLESAEKLHVAQSAAERLQREKERLAARYDASCRQSDLQLAELDAAKATAESTKESQAASQASTHAEAQTSAQALADENQRLTQQLAEAEAAAQQAAAQQATMQTASAGYKAGYKTLSEELIQATTAQAEQEAALALAEVKLAGLTASPRSAATANEAMIRVRLHIIGNVRIKNVGKYQSCMFSN